MPPASATSNQPFVQKDTAPSRLDSFLPSDPMPLEDDGLPSREFRPFDPTLVTRASNGGAVRFLDTALDARYLMPVPDAWRTDVPPGMLPPQDLELRKALDSWRESLAELGTYGLLVRLSRRTVYKQALARAELHERRVRALLRKSREHLAAARRIVAQDEGRDVLSKPLQLLVAAEARAHRR